MCRSQERDLLAWQNVELARQPHVEKRVLAANAAPAMGLADPCSMGSIRP